jgi:hypothetical protein
MVCTPDVHVAFQLIKQSATFLNRQTCRTNDADIYTMDAYTSLAQYQNMIFIETPVFTRQIAELLDDDAYSAFQRELASNPEAGNVISGTGGLRKIRIPAKGHGKHGGGRAIYYYFASASRIGLLPAYSKSVQADLTPTQKKTLTKIIEIWK